VDARNIRSIILMRPIRTIIEFKQIIGRGTRLFDGKEYFTIYDFVDAHNHFADPEWDGEPEDPIIGDPRPCPVCGKRPCICEKETPEPCTICGKTPCECSKKVKVKIKLRDGKEREIQHMATTLFYDADGKPLTAEQFMEKLFGKLPDFFKNEEQLRAIWSKPDTRKALLEKLAEAGFGKEQLQIMQSLINAEMLEKLAEAGFGKEQLQIMQSLINAEKSDLFDVLEYVSYAIQPITRELRVAKAQTNIFSALSNEQKQFVEFVLSKYIETGVEELDQEKLPDLLKLKYHALDDAKQILGSVQAISNIFIEFQKFLYVQQAAV